jgi:hypothetical protein
VAEVGERAMSALEELLRHIDACPLGWNDGKLMTTRSTTEADVLAWVQKLHHLRSAFPELAGTDSQANRR